MAGFRFFACSGVVVAASGRKAWAEASRVGEGVLMQGIEGVGVVAVEQW
jgi:hypothetical protein